ncbi:hypothetical protein A2230_07090 [candidate division WOR-1 bacterium RIFOXYA2_FULL_36_21]|uniref:Uncharacterized protein n=1 Tax=candidate division WOR-1 bacterium RIFOXYB2_FULL_36_35 TaxID=1802578 RepID=A0A1F4SAJ9_UNCSA|nr:MAG: hypothetical protein A2230_07090 [candidate division WOR-1 bacterium RIFOXYA2_FULL_36_21]OGC16773.1 MAG: hypothetical protein A2290_00245 [candidate division WOR-1 bacterium RIFOXYB2_FULL_36_35]OGC19741.1 MAG: hypothetical protein A2282_08930 [candidate division WOR-1 bacterium RIFOXYA12_FULL_36_13]
MEEKISKFLLIGFLMTFVIFVSTEARIEKLTTKFSADINKDGKKELLVHDFYGGTAGFGELRIYNLKGEKIFAKKVEGDPYLWHPEKHLPALNPNFFPDMDKDGIVEILIGYRKETGVLSHVEELWWFDVYKWNGKTYILADAKFPDFYKDQFVYYASFLKQNGTCETVEKFIKKAQRLAGIKIATWRYL